ncbi:hypothetical protein [Terrihalobacillus insolitus]|uniref:hypothetical protein n=1 Tax=Terrihalobacillus insolitus TaxID=2950438 RepID=UPI00234178FC|nr:hypothetical protein [Terrihalobacillus insolitus]MDC3413941.1 hypothetical protein [Terrihalobacillus insolitus]
MSIIMGRGDEAKKAIESKGGNLDLKKAFIRLKAGQSRKVRVLTPQDYVAYKAHGHYSKGVYTQPCIAVAGERCVLCEAANYDGDLVEKDKDGKSVWNQMYAKKRVLFAFVDLEEDMIRVFDATKAQADGLIATIDEYAEDLDSIAFTFKRTGDKQETSYTLAPILPNKMKEVQEVFDKYNGVEVETKLFEEALQARTTEQQAKELQQAGFPVKDVLGIEVKVAASENNEDEGEPIDENEDPTKDF